MVWFMFETSFWPLRGDRNVGGREKAGRPSGLGRPSSAFAQAVPVCRKCPSPLARLPWRATGTQAHLPITYNLLNWLASGYLLEAAPPECPRLRWLSPPGVSLPFEHYWDTGHMAAPHLRGQLAHQTRSSLSGAPVLGSCCAPKPS